MSKPKFTPGPWGVKKRIDIWVMAGVLHVATIPRTADGDWSCHNAHLISAAPDMYEALKEVAERLRNCATNIEEEYPIWAGDLRKMAESADAALAKAEGKT